MDFKNRPEDLHEKYLRRELCEKRDKVSKKNMTRKRTAIPPQKRPVKKKPGTSGLAIQLRDFVSHIGQERGRYR